MKKLFLLSLSALCALAIDAQITKVGTFQGEPLSTASYIYGHGYGDPIKYTATADTTSSTNFQVKIVSLDDCKIYKTINLSKTTKQKPYLYGQVTKNFWTNDGKLVFGLDLLESINHNDVSTLKIIDEDGNEIITFKDYPEIVEDENVYYILDYDQSTKQTTVYSMPKYTTTDISSTSAPARTNVRKVIEDGQLYIIVDGVKYAVSGSQIL